MMGCQTLAGRKLRRLEPQERRPMLVNRGEFLQLVGGKTGDPVTERHIQYRKIHGLHSR